jgi:hypothetical protein
MLRFRLHLSQRFLQGDKTVHQPQQGYRTGRHVHDVVNIDSNILIMGLAFLNPKVIISKARLEFQVS